MTQRIGHVSMWHPWLDKKGVHHDIAIIDDGVIVNVETGQIHEINDAFEFFKVITENRLYVMVNDVVDNQELPFLQDLLHMKNVHARLTQTKMTGISMNVPFTNKTGSVIPYSNFVENRYDVKRIKEYFEIMGFEGISIGAVSEKLFRSTLPRYHKISRPNALLRQKLVDNAFGGRMHYTNGKTEKYAVVYEYDFNNAYLRQARNIPDPRETPTRISKHDNLGDYAAAFVNVTITPQDCTIGPLPWRQKTTNAQLFPNKYNLPLTGWWWWDEIKEAEKAGFTINEIHSGWAWENLSNIMSNWANLMMEKKSSASNDPVLQKMIKISMVALPGRFQTKPEKFNLIPIEEAETQDYPLILNNWQNGVHSDFAIKMQKFHESAALVPQGSYIVMKQRRTLYKLMTELEKLGNRVLHANTDNVYTDKPIPHEFECLIGTSDGMLKEKIHTNVIISSNRVVSDQAIKIPGVADELLRLKIAQGLRNA